MTEFIAFIANQKIGKQDLQARERWWQNPNSTTSWNWGVENQTKTKYKSTKTIWKQELGARLDWNILGWL